MNTNTIPTVETDLFSLTQHGVDGDLPIRIALHRGNNGWATHIEAMQADGQPHNPPRYMRGNYFADYGAALNNFKLRCQSIGVAY